MSREGVEPVTGPPLFLLTAGAAAVRLLIGGVLAWWVAAASVAPEMRGVCAVAALVTFALSLWRPASGLLLVAGLAPAGTLLAPPPARAAELLAWALLAGWLLRVWRPLSAAPWPRALAVPATLYGAAVATSWLTLTVAGAAGVALTALPQFLIASVPPDHLILSSPEPETWSMLQTVTGVGVLLAAAGIVGEDRGLVRPLAWAVVASAAILGLATVAEIARQWIEVGFGGWFLWRYVTGVRFSLHMPDLNAAGSLYILAGLTAVSLATFDRDRRRLWLALLAAMLPALWLTGSRAAVIAACAVGAATIAAAARQRRWTLTRAQAAAAVIVAVVVVSASAVVLTRRTEEGDSAARSMRLRGQFYETTARMFASAPLDGVGIGRYFDRSSEFMPDELRSIYGNENAHNYFAQQFGELGVVGGGLFVWLIVPAVVRGWRRVRAADPGGGVVVGLFAGSSAYLLTCITGHPLLVPEAALPFWATFGAIAAAASEHQRSGDDLRTRVMRHAAVVLVSLLLVAQAGRALASHASTTAPPAEHGFHGLETAPDGTRFRWMTRHAVAYVPSGPGFLRLRLRAADLPTERPLVVETAIAGRVVDRRTVPADRWVTYDIATRRPVSTPFQRVDLRANQVWTEEVRLGRRTAWRPIAVMVGEIGWTPLEDVP